MVEFFRSLFQWFVYNKDEILLFLSSTNVVGFVSNIVLAYKQIRATAVSNATVSSLADPLESVNSLSKDVESSLETSQRALAQSQTIMLEITQFKSDVTETLDILQQKIDAILDVQSIVYSSLRDEVARKNVSNILVTAKLIDKAKIVELEQQLENLKNTVDSKVEDVKQIVDTETAKAKKTVATKKAAATKKAIVSRY